jgi:hypothetical protein
MKPKDVQEEIASLEAKLEKYEILLNNSIDANEEFAKTRAVLHELRKIRQKLDKMKGTPEEN